MGSSNRGIGELWDQQKVELETHGITESLNHGISKSRDRTIA